MKIAIFASAFYPQLGGVEELVRQSAHVLRRRGHDVIVLTNRWPRSLPVNDSFEGIPTYRIAMRTVATEQFITRQNVMYYLSRPFIQQQVVDILRKHRSEMLHVQCVSGNADLALAAKRFLGLPLVVTMNGELTMDSRGLYQRSESARALMRDTLRGADYLTACSLQTLQEAENFYGQPFGNRGSVIYNGIEVEEFLQAPPFQHPRPYILAIGRLVPQKGFDVLVQAYAVLRDKLRDVPDLLPDLLLAGEGTGRPALEQSIAELGLQGRAHLLGRAEHEKKLSLFAGCHFFVLSSNHEAFGIVNLEAMAAGKAIVATRVGGVPEFIQHEREALMVPPKEPEAMAAAMERLCREPQLLARLAENGARKVQEFRWDAIAARYEAAYTAARDNNLPLARRLAGGERVAGSPAR